MQSERPELRQNVLGKEPFLGKMKTAISVVSGNHLPRRPVPIDKICKADLVGIKGVRAWNGQYSRLFRADIAKSMLQENKGQFPANKDGSRTYDILAISGGGANGAFGAGFIYGWTRAGNRPKFKLATGISSGAIVATMAFLGPEFDHVLKEIYTTIVTCNVYKRRNLISMLWSESFAHTKPLEDLAEKYVNQKLLDALAEAYASGRRLYIGTTNLDAQRLVLWNMGQIAHSGHPDAIGILRKVLLASLSIPCIFPPVYFDVQLDGQMYDEMHVDGSMITDVFFCDFMLNFPSADGGAAQNKSRIYVIRNDKFASSPEHIFRSIPKITRRSLSTLNKAHAEDHLHRIYAATERNNADFNYTGIPEDCFLPDKLIFNKTEMNKLFDLGADLAKSDHQWHKIPPNYNTA